MNPQTYNAIYACFCLGILGAFLALLYWSFFSSEEKERRWAERVCAVCLLLCVALRTNMSVLGPPAIAESAPGAQSQNRQEVVEASNKLSNHSGESQ